MERKKQKCRWKERNKNVDGKKGTDIDGESTVGITESVLMHNAIFPYHLSREDSTVLFSLLFVCLWVVVVFHHILGNKS